MTVKLAIYCRVAGEDEFMGVREFDFAPRAGETLEIERHGETLHLHIEQVRHRVDDGGHLPKLMCVRVHGA